MGAWPGCQKLTDACTHCQRSTGAAAPTAPAVTRALKIIITPSKKILIKLHFQRRLDRRSICCNNPGLLLANKARLEDSINFLSFLASQGAGP